MQILACVRRYLAKSILAVWRLRAKRHLRNWRDRSVWAMERVAPPLPNLVFEHDSKLLRRLEGVDQQLQKNKIKNLELAIARLNGLILKPGEVFSFWRLVGKPTRRAGYLPGLAFMGGEFEAEIGGGLCQLANLIYWLVLHSPLEVIERHHHSQDLFPDDERRVPFGVGATIFYNFKDLRFLNPTAQRFQLLVWLSDDQLHGALRSEKPLGVEYRILEEGHGFVRDETAGQTYRTNKIIREEVDAAGRILKREVLMENRALVKYQLPSDARLGS